MQSSKRHGTSSTYKYGLGVNEGKMLKQKISDKKLVKAKNAELLDWLLAIDACLT